jgi:hypothetical protein
MLNCSLKYIMLFSSSLSHSKYQEFEGTQYNKIKMWFWVSKQNKCPTTHSLKLFFSANIVGIWTLQQLSEAIYNLILFEVPHVVPKIFVFYNLCLRAMVYVLLQLERKEIKRKHQSYSLTQLK